MFLLGLFFLLPNTMASDNATTYQLWQVSFENGSLTDEVSKKLQQQDIWRQDGNTIVFLLHENNTIYWSDLLKTHNISHNVLLKKVPVKINPDMIMNNYDGRRGMTWTLYPKLNVIYTYLSEVAAKNPSICTLSVIGKTAHRKDIKMLKIRNNNVKRHTPILIDAGIYGRDWTAVMSVLHLIERIVWNFTKQPDHIQTKEWNIIPVVNPDGYEYSMSTDHSWRKNRRRLSGRCYGVDINRNFDYKWCEGDISVDTCSNSYCGSMPFSEPESLAIKNVIESHRFYAYVSVHSFGSKVLYPWLPRGSTHDAPMHIGVCHEMVEAMRKVNGENFKPGHINDPGLLSGTGTSMHWSYFVQNIANSYVIETRGDYFLDSEHLVIAAKEVRAGIMRLAEIIY